MNRIGVRKPMQIVFERENNLRQAIYKQPNARWKQTAMKQKQAPARSVIRKPLPSMNPDLKLVPIIPLSSSRCEGVSPAQKLKILRPVGY